MSCHIYYTPHSDDESIGMAGSIAQAKAAGARVVLLLLTDSLPSRRLQRMFRAELLCPIHSRFHVYPVDLAACRRVEFRAAARALGVDEVSEVDIPESLVAIDRPLFLERVAALVHAQAMTYPDAVHHFVSGDADVAMPDQQRTHHTHRACWEVGMAAAGEGLAVRFHRIYTYRHRLAERTAPEIITLDEATMAVKRAALAAYQVWDPPHHRVAYAYHSVPDLLVAAEEDPREFLDPVTPEVQ